MLAKQANKNKASDIDNKPNFGTEKIEMQTKQ